MEGPLRDTQIKNPFVGLIIVVSITVKCIKPNVLREVSDVVQPNHHLPHLAQLAGLVQCGVMKIVTEKQKKEEKDFVYSM